MTGVNDSLLNIGSGDYREYEVEFHGAAGEVMKDGSLLVACVVTGDDGGWIPTGSAKSYALIKCLLDSSCSIKPHNLDLFLFANSVKGVSHESLKTFVTGFITGRGCDFSQIVADADCVKSIIEACRNNFKNHAAAAFESISIQDD